jgi:hypothetical protein
MFTIYRHINAHILSPAGSLVTGLLPNGKPETSMIVLHLTKSYLNKFFIFLSPVPYITSGTYIK